MSDRSWSSIESALQLFHHLQYRLLLLLEFSKLLPDYAFSARMSVTSRSRLVGGDCGAWARAKFASNAKDANINGAENLTGKGRIHMAVFSVQVVRILYLSRCL